MREAVLFQRAAQLCSAVAGVALGDATLRNPTLYDMALWRHGGTDILLVVTDTGIVKVDPSTGASKGAYLEGSSNTGWRQAEIEVPVPDGDVYVLLYAQSGGTGCNGAKEAPVDATVHRCSKTSPTCSFSGEAFKTWTYPDSGSHPSPQSMFMKDERTMFVVERDGGGLVKMAGAAPLQVVVILDGSGSITPQWTTCTKAASAIVTALYDTLQCSMMAGWLEFSSGNNVNVRVPLGSKTPVQVATSIRTWPRNQHGGTYYAGPLVECYNQIQSKPLQDAFKASPPPRTACSCRHCLLWMARVDAGYSIIC